MNTTTEKTATPKAAPKAFKRGKKITAEILKFSDHETGFSFIGKLIGRSEKPWMDKETGEMKQIPVFHFEQENSERINVFGDSGLVNAMTGANVQENDWIEIVKLGKTSLGGGKTVNQYDIFTSSN